MSIAQPRRIFRSGSWIAARGRFGHNPSPTVVAGIIGAISGAALVMLLMPADLFGRAPDPAGTLAADSRAVGIIDGETLKLHDTVIRLEGLAAPPRGRSCAAASGAVYDCGAAATTELARLILEHGVQCRLRGRDAAGFVQGLCSSDGVSLNEALVRGGWARSEPSSSASPGLFGPAEADARLQRRGLWQGSAEPEF